MQNFSNVSFNATVNPLVVLQKQSLALLQIVNSGPSQLFVVLSIVGFFSGFSVFSTIVFNKNLHEKNYVLVACVSVGDMLLAPTLFSIGIRRIIAYQSNTPTLFTQFQCMWEDCSRVIVMGIINSFFLGCAIDRFLAIVKPHWYSSVYPMWLFKCGVVITFLRAASEGFIIFWGSSKDVIIPLCAYTFATTTDVLDAQSIRSSTVLGCSCVVYVSTIAIVYTRLAKIKKQKGNVTETRKQMQLKIIWTLALMWGGYVATVIASAILYRYTFTKTFDVQVKYGAVGFTFQEFSSACNLIILTWRNQDFRNGLLRLYGIRRNDNNNSQTGSTSSKKTQNSLLFVKSRKLPTTGV